MGKSFYCYRCAKTTNHAKHGGAGSKIVYQCTSCGNKKVRDRDAKTKTHVAEVQKELA